MAEMVSARFVPQGGDRVLIEPLRGTGRSLMSSPTAVVTLKQAKSIIRTESARNLLTWGRAVTARVYASRLRGL